MAIRKIKVAVKKRVKLNPRVKLDEQQLREKNAVRVEAAPKKVLFTRTEQADGAYLVNYYYVRSETGALIPEDIRKATHYERVFYDSDSNAIGSIIGELRGDIHW